MVGYTVVVGTTTITFSTAPSAGHWWSEKQLPTRKRVALPDMKRTSCFWIYRCPGSTGSMRPSVLWSRPQCR